MPKLRCPCGFVHNLSPIPDDGWQTVRDRDFEAFQETILASKQGDERASLRVGDYCGVLYECPECGRLMWRAPDRAFPVFRVFKPESHPPKKEAGPWLNKTIEQCIMDSRMRRVSLVEVEKVSIVNGVLFGCAGKEWHEFKDHLREGDELWYFRTPEETWTTVFPRCGMEGYAIVREGKLITEFLTSQS